MPVIDKKSHDTNVSKIAKTALKDIMSALSMIPLSEGVETKLQQSSTGNINSVNSYSIDIDVVLMNTAVVNTLCNNNAAASRVKRFSEDLDSSHELEMSENYRPQARKRSKKSKTSHVIYKADSDWVNVNPDQSNTAEPQSFIFVQHKARNFGRGVSSSDNHLDNPPDFTDRVEIVADICEQDSWSVCSDRSVTSHHSPNTTPANSHEEINNLSIEFEDENLHTKTLEQSKQEYSSSLENVNNMLDTQSFCSGQLLGWTSVSSQLSLHKDIHESSLATIEIQSDVDLSGADSTKGIQDADISTPVENSYNKIDVTSSVDGHVTSDGSDKGLPLCQQSVLVTVEDEEDEGGKEQQLSGDSVLTYHPGTALTHLVDIDRLNTSLGSLQLSSDESTKNEKQLELLLKSGSSRGFKSYLRKSQWAVESLDRLHLWENLCRSLLKAQGNLYHKLVKDMISDEEDKELTLPSFVDPDLKQCYYLTAAGQKEAGTVIQLMGTLHPEVTFCPLLYPVACLLLHYMLPQSCFNCLQSLLASTSTFYFTQTQAKAEAFKCVLRDLARKYAKQAYALFIRRAKSVEAVFEHWMLWIFRDLPFQYLLKIVDCFLLEGYKVFYRVSLAIAILFAKDYSKSNSNDTLAVNIHEDISKFCKNLSLDPKKFIQVGFGIRGLSRREIEKLHDKNEGCMSSIHSGFTRTRLQEPVSSEILLPEMFQTLWQWIPVRLSLMRPVLLFSSNEHGTTIRTLYTLTEHAPFTILVIQSTKNEIFGAFCSSAWYTRHEKNRPKTSFFGTGETYVFTVQPKLKCYPWSSLSPGSTERTADLFMAGDDHMMMIGSGNGTAIYMDAMMNRCSSTSCDTFANEPLCTGPDFSCKVVEVFGFSE